MAEIYLEKVQLDGGVFRLDLKGKSLPKNFLGMAFDLKYQKSAEYSRFEFADAFKGVPADQMPVYMLKDLGDKLIFGMTRTAQTAAQSGSTKSFLASFYFQGDPGEVFFERNVFSVIDQENRKDINNMTWLGIVSEKAELTKVPKATTAKKATTTKANTAKRVSGVEWTGGTAESTKPAEYTLEDLQASVFGMEGLTALMAILLVAMVTWFVQKTRPHWQKWKIALLSKLIKNKKVTE